jgi:hypothetical protein
VRFAAESTGLMARKREMTRGASETLPRRSARPFCEPRKWLRRRAHTRSSLPHMTCQLCDSRATGRCLAKQQSTRRRGHMSLHREKVRLSGNKISNFVLTRFEFTTRIWCVDVIALAMCSRRRRRLRPWVSLEFWTESVMASHDQIQVAQQSVHASGRSVRIGQRKHLDLNEHV